MKNVRLRAINEDALCQLLAPTGMTIRTTPQAHIHQALPTKKIGSSTSRTQILCPPFLLGTDMESLCVTIRYLVKQPWDQTPPPSSSRGIYEMIYIAQFVGSLVSSTVE